MARFTGKVLVIGCGSISQSVIPLFLKHVDIPPSNITVIDYVDNREKIKSSLEKGVRYVEEKITRENYQEVLKKYIKSGDFLIDLSWNIDTCALLDYCHEHNILYINTSVELWAPYGEDRQQTPTELTLYVRQMAIKKMIAGWKDKKGATSVVDHGANPGLVSHLTKQALLDIGEKILKDKPADPRKKALEKALAEKSFGTLALLEGVKVIHISERDTQIIDKPKQVNEFVNTWSVEGLIEEGIAPAELGWGTHERYAPKGAFFHAEGPKNQICLSSRGMNTWVRSWVPSGDITGMVIRHGEAYSLSHYLTVYENDKAIYRPTVHYAYCPSDGAINSMHEFEMRQFVSQDKRRILTDEIISGKDELGCLLMGHDFKSWWIGSILDIHHARTLLPGQSATTVQVSIGVVAACLWMINHPQMGFCQPEDLDHEEVLSVAKPYLGEFISKPVDWSPLRRKNSFLDYSCKAVNPEDEWQFTTFLLSNHEKEPVPKDY